MIKASLLDRILGKNWHAQMGNAEQPRWPKGDPRGGQWKDSGSLPRKTGYASETKPGLDDLKITSLFSGATLSQSNPDHRKLVEKLVAADIPDQQRLQLVDAILRSGVPVEHLAGLNSITTGEDVKHGIVDVGPNYLAGGLQAAGYYDIFSRTIYLHRSVAQSSYVFAHELGHHVHIPAFVRGDQTMTNAALEVMSKVKTKTDSELETVGLRRYSMTNNQEFLADTYAALTGNGSTKAQQTALLALWDKKTPDDIFKKRSVANKKPVKRK
jgi:hypothetical protein